MIEIKPIKESTTDFEAIEREIADVFKRELYRPLLDILKSKTVRNANDDLIKAITSGRVTYYRGEFDGRFSATVSRELKKLGAKWKDGKWKINLSGLPQDVQDSVRSSESVFQKTASRINKKLQELLPEEIAGTMKFEKLFDTLLWKVDKNIKSSLKGIIVPPQLTPERRAKISEEYSTNLKLYIKGWLKDEILELRQKVEKQIFKGDRYESLVSMIQKSYGVGHRKAKFLARQETSLLMTKFKESRYTDSGVHEYRWVCVHMPHDKTPKQHTPGNVRYSHGILEGKIFRWDTPPITTPPGESVRRNNPGQDFNCRCAAIPIVNF